MTISNRVFRVTAQKVQEEFATMNERIQKWHDKDYRKLYSKFIADDLYDLMIKRRDDWGAIKSVYDAYYRKNEHKYQEAIERLDFSPLPIKYDYSGGYHFFVWKVNGAPSRLTVFNMFNLTRKVYFTIEPTGKTPEAIMDEGLRLISCLPRIVKRLYELSQEIQCHIQIKIIDKFERILHNIDTVVVHYYHSAKRVNDVAERIISIVDQEARWGHVRLLREGRASQGFDLKKIINDEGLSHGEIIGKLMARHIVYETPKEINDTEALARWLEKYLDYYSKMNIADALPIIKEVWN